MAFSAIARRLRAAPLLVALSLGPAMAQEFISDEVLLDLPEVQDIAREPAVPGTPEPIPVERYDLNFYGLPGMIDMPTAESMPDGEFAVTVGYFGGQLRNTLAFQITPRLTGAFRYIRIEGPRFPDGRTFDRNFDIKYRVLDEGRYLPSVAVGLRDFGGTGLYAGEYVVATKTIVPNLTVTGGLGWGRLGSRNGFDNPLGVIDSRFDTRPRRSIGVGGTAAFDEFFRGDAAFFGGVQWRATDRITVSAEYSSAAYVGREGGTVDADSPFNIGATYRTSRGAVVGAHYLYGSEFGVTATFALNPKRPPAGASGIGPGGPPVEPRGQADPALLAATVSDQDIVVATLTPLLATQGLGLESVLVVGNAVDLRVRNERYETVAQAVGRAARILTIAMPPSVEVFRIVPVENGLPLSAVVMRRSDIEANENAPSAALRQWGETRIEEAGPRPDGSGLNPDLYPAFTYGLGPYLALSYFDPDSPVRADLGLELGARAELAPGLIVKGNLRYRLVGNRDDSDRVSDSVLPRVRSESFLYAREDLALTDLQGAYYFRPGPNLYGRVSAGYLERQFGGVSTELLWKPVASRLALGAELNYAVQRETDSLFGFRDYDVVTGHASAYYDIGNGFHGQIDAGRYLAGDYGATFTLTREFANGWRVGAYATFTDVSAAEFGEGSFDKGIRIEIPLRWLTGQPSRGGTDFTIQPILRDGGARLAVDGRLYDFVRDGHEPEIEKDWGLFWR